MIFFEGKSISEEELASGELPEASPEILYSLRICQQWMQGNTDFTINTSGSTGPAKAISLSREQLLASAKTTGDFLGYQKGDSMLVCLATNRIGGMMQLVRAMEWQMTVKIEIGSRERETGGFGSMFHAILWKGKREARNEFTHTSLTPHLTQKILNQSNGHQILSSFKTILIGGSGVNKELKEKLSGFKNSIYQTYGMTETCSNIAMMRLSQLSEDHFKPLPGVQIAVDDDGCLRICCPATTNEWIKSNDLVQIHNDNSFDFLGRADFVINSGGVKINPEWLELEIATLFAGRPFMVSSKPSEVYGEEVVMVLESIEDIDQLKLLNEIRKKVGGIHCPKRIIVVAVIPLTATHKPDRLALRRLICG
ncbi:MAG: hypothetical protein EXR21_06125 [Flavobacteriaceae bacterium]|nr:hypothetical protein [Flavobacteriaceae bacterium]